MSQTTPTALLAAFLVLSPAIFWYGLVEPFESLKSALTQLAALALLATAGWRWGDVRRLFGGPVGLSVAAGVAVAALSTAFSSCPLLSLLGDTDSHGGLGHAVALAVIFAAGRAAGARGDLLGASAVGLAIACGYASVQMAGLDPLRWDHGSAFHAWDRPGGTLGHPSYLAGYAVMALPLLAWRAAEGGWRTKVAGGLLAAVAIAVVVAALSRGAWLAGGAAAAATFALWPGRRRLAWCGGLLLGVVVLGGAACLLLGEPFVASLQERFVRLAHSPGRRPVWLAAWQVFLDHPWLGSGLDTFGPAFTRVRTPEYWQVEWGLLPRRAHNDLLQALATQGLAGGVVYAGLAVALVTTCVRAWRQQPGRRRLVAALLGAVVAFYVQNVFGFAVAATSALFAVLTGTVAALDDGEPVASEPPRWPVVAAGVLACMVVVMSLSHGENVLGATLILVVAAALGLAATWRAAGLSPAARTARMNPAAHLVPALVALPLAWLVAAPVVASIVSRRADADPSWHTVAVRLAPWHDLFHTRRCDAALRAVEAEPTAGKRARLDEARRAAEEACRLVPRRAAHHVNLGRALLELARAGAAEPGGTLAAFDRALDLDPCDTLTFADAARAATALGRLDDADRYVRRGLAIDPGLGPLHAERGTALLARATRPFDAALLARAEEALRAVMTMDWHGDDERLDRARLVLALALVQRGEAAEALVHAEEVRRRRPGWPSPAWMAAVALERGGQRDEALQAYRAVLRHWPDNPQAAAGVARLTK